MTRTKQALAVAAGAAAVAATRHVGKPTTSPYGDDALPDLDGRVRRVELQDGVRLHVEVHGPDDAAGTVVLGHGYIQSNRVWDRQVAALLAARPDLSVVTFDHRGHGLSDRSAAERCTLEQLGRDLVALLDDTAPTGPVVVVGHSMGGMAVMALAEQFPEQIGPRVVGAALLATSPGRLTEVTYGLPRAVARAAQAMLPKANEAARKRELAGKKALPNAWLSHLIFGKDARPSDVRRTMEVMAQCSAATIADFHASFVEHDRLAALAALGQVPVLVLVGSKDLICPVSHSEDIAHELPHAQLKVYPGAGHMLQVERDAEVSAALVELCDATLPEEAGRQAS